MGVCRTQEVVDAIAGSKPASHSAEVVIDAAETILEAQRRATVVVRKKQDIEFRFGEKACAFRLISCTVIF